MIKIKEYKDLQIIAERWGDDFYKAYILDPRFRLGYPGNIVKVKKKFLRSVEDVFKWGVKYIDKIKLS